MTLNEAKRQAELIFKQDAPDLVFENKGQIKYIYRKPAEGEELTPVEGTDRVKTRDGEKRLIDGRLLLGGGTSWLATLKQAAKERLTEIRTKNQERQTKQRAAEQEAQVSLAKFMEFLQTKFEKEYEAYLNVGKEPAVPEVPASESGRP